MAKPVEKTAEEEKKSGKTRSRRNRGHGKPARASAEKSVDRKEAAATTPAEAEEKSKNDVTWYSKDPQLLLDASRFTFAEAFGSRYGTLGAGKNALNVSGNLGLQGPYVGTLAPKYSGIYTYHIKSTIGECSGAKDPANVAATMLYAQMRHVNSGRKNYDAADAAMYTLSIADLYAMVAFCEKLYAGAYMFSQRNQFIGKEVLVACGVDPENLVNNLANFRYWLNTFINKISTYAIPQDITYFNLKIQMYSGLYLENGENNLKDELYQAVPDGFYKFELDGSGKGCLIYKPYTAGVGGALWTYPQLITYFESFLSNIWADEDFALISGDMFKAFDGKLIGLAPQGDDAALIPVWDPYMLEKFHNARVIKLADASQYTYTIDSMNSAVPGSIYQRNDGNLEHHEAAAKITNLYDAANQLNAKSDDIILDVHSVEPDPGLIVECTRWTSFINGSKAYQSGGNTVNLDTVIHGTEIVTAIDVTIPLTPAEQAAQSLSRRFKVFKDVVPCFVVNGSNQGGGTYAMQVLRDNGSNTGTTLQNEEALERMLSLSMGNYTPITYLWYVELVSGNVYYTTSARVISQVSNFTFVKQEQIERLHEVALLSLLSVPGVAKVL